MLGADLEDRLIRFLELSVENSRKRWIESPASWISICTLLFAAWGLLQSEIDLSQKEQKISALQREEAFTRSYLEWAIPSVARLSEIIAEKENSIKEKEQRARQAEEKLAQTRSDAFYRAIELEREVINLHVQEARLRSETRQRRLDIADLETRTEQASQAAENARSRLSQISSRLKNLAIYAELDTLTTNAIADLISTRLIQADRHCTACLRSHVVGFQITYPAVYEEEIRDRIGRVFFLDPYLANGQPFRLRRLEGINNPNRSDGLGNTWLTWVKASEAPTKYYAEVYIKHESNAAIEVCYRVPFPRGSAGPEDLASCGSFYVDEGSYTPFPLPISNSRP